VHEELRMKGVSPLVATVLLIATVIVVAGIVSAWVYNFAKSSTTTMRKQSDDEVFCSKADITFSGARYCNNILSGVMDNTGTVALENITFQVIYQNASREKISLNRSAGMPLSIAPGDLYNFNFSLSSNYDMILVALNCTGKMFYVQRGDIAAC